MKKYFKMKNKIHDEKIQDEKKLNIQDEKNSMIIFFSLIFQNAGVATRT